MGLVRWSRLSRPREDVRFEIEALAEPELGATHSVLIVSNETDEVLETHITDNPYGMVEAHREAEAWLAENPGRYLLERLEEEPCDERWN